jgi:hypothetical protein
MTRRKRVDRRSGEKESERVFSVEIEAEEAFLTNEPEGFIKRQGGLIVVLSLENDLVHASK